MARHTRRCRTAPLALALLLACAAVAIGQEAGPGRVPAAPAVARAAAANASALPSPPPAPPALPAPFSPDPGGLEPVEDAQEPRPLEAGGAAGTVGAAEAQPGADANAKGGEVSEREREEAEEAAAEREREEEAEREEARAPGAPPKSEAEREREEDREEERGVGEPASAERAEREREEEEAEEAEEALEAKLAAGEPVTAAEWAAEAAREAAEKREGQTEAERAADARARGAEAARLARWYARLGMSASAPRPTAGQLAAETKAANPAAAAAERRSEAKEKDGGKKKGGPAHGSAGPTPRGAGGGASPGAPAPPPTAAGGSPPSPPPPKPAPINPAFPSPVGTAFPVPPKSPPAPRGLSLSADLPPLYEPAAGGRGLAPDLLDGTRGGGTSFAAIARRVARDAAWLAANAATLDDMQAAENEKPTPRRGGSLEKRVRAAGGANSFGARPDDVPTVAVPAKVAPAGPRVASASALAASRTLLAGRPNPDSPITLSFAANAAVDQPVRRFRPPDQALCVGGGHAIVGANALWRSFNAETGAPEEGPTSVTDFFNLTGNFSDPGCIFDGSGTRRFFLSFFRFNEKSPSKFSHFVVAVSASSDPADGFIGPYIFPNDGLDSAGKPLPGLEACAGSKDPGTGFVYEGGCLGDYPSVGLDAHSLWAGFNLFATEPREAYAGVLMLAIDKAGLVSGAAATPAYAAYSNWDPELAYTVQPAVTQAGTPHDGRGGGSIYLTSSGPVSQNEPNQPLLAVWAATRTDRLADPAFPSSGLPLISGAALLDVPAYADPNVLDGERFCMPQPDPGVPLDAGDARTLQSVWSGGLVWTAAQTVLRAGPAAPKAVGAVWWAVRPEWGGGGKGGGARGPSTTASSASSPAFTPVLNATGYVAVPGHHASRPAITASPSGLQAWIGGTLVGDDLPPSPFVAQIHIGGGGSVPPSGPLTAGAHLTTIHMPSIAPDILAPGIPDRAWDRAEPDLGGTLRSGDYSAATLDERGRAWLASQWSGSVPSPVCVEKFAPVKCPNWGTYVTRVDTDVVADGVDGLGAAAKATAPGRAGFGALSGFGSGGAAAEPPIGGTGGVASAASKPQAGGGPKPGPSRAPAAGGDASGGALAAAADASRKKTKESKSAGRAGGVGGVPGPKRRGEEEEGSEAGPGGGVATATPAPSPGT